VSLLEQLGITTQVIARRGLRACPEARDLALAETGEDGAGHLLARDAASAWRRLSLAARQDGIELFLVSGYRSVERQAEMIRRRLKRGKTLEEILALCAPPGFSEHHTGLAVDLGARGAPERESAFAETTAFRWLERHAVDSGFFLSYPRGNAQGFQFEPWHWCYRR
jgi:D-alanyl-D-alanine carboxypeptidase